MLRYARSSGNASETYPSQLSKRRASPLGDRVLAEQCLYHIDGMQAVRYAAATVEMMSGIFDDPGRAVPK